MTGQPHNKWFLRRTAFEIKKYQILMRILAAAAAALTVLVSIIYIFSIMYNKFGSFTVRVNKFDSVKYAITLSETPDFVTQSMRLNAMANEDVTCISVNDIPQDVDMVNGSHNGNNYVAYTFYMKNAGQLTINCEYWLYIANATKGLETAVRVRLYVNGEYNDFARTRTDGGGAEFGTVEFYNETVITRERLTNLRQGDITKFTVVIWLEGDDPDCVDSLIGGQLKVDMNISIIGESEDETVNIAEAYNSTAIEAPKLPFIKIKNTNKESLV